LGDEMNFMRSSLCEFAQRMRDEHELKDPTCSPPD